MRFHCIITFRPHPLSKKHIRISHPINIFGPNKVESWNFEQTNIRKYKIQNPKPTVLSQEVEQTEPAVKVSETKEENDNDDDDNVDEHQNSDEPTENEEMPADQVDTNDSNGKEATDPVMEIEGVVHGEADNNVVQSASRLTTVDDEDNKV